MSANTEKWPIVALLPIGGTGLFYLLPHSLQQQTIIQFLPQTLAYIGLAIWVRVNTKLGFRLGIQSHQLLDGLKQGCVVGLALGLCNTIIVLKIVPAIGSDITFLTQTPHAQIPTLLMVPWTIMAIAIAVEFNFRGFLLGRLLTLFLTSRQTVRPLKSHTRSSAQTMTILLSALVFAFDPFMVATFQHLHWIAVWDGVIWGWLWVRFRNLYTVITAHAVEVMVLYTLIKIALT